MFKIKASRFLFFVSLFSVLILFGCKAKKEVAAVSNCNLQSKSKDSLLFLLKKNQLDFVTLFGKFEAEVTIDSNKTSFNVTMKIRKDSAIWMSISPALGIEVAKAIITKDSVKYINWIDKTYFSGDFNYINKLLQADLDYEMLQSLLVGNSVDFYEDDDKLHTSIHSCKYLLSTVRKRKLRRVMQKNKEFRDPIQSIWMENQIFKISRILFNDFNTNRTFDAGFQKFETVDNFVIPFIVNYDIKAEKRVIIQIEYTKLTLNKPQTFSFRIPEKYERIIHKEKEK